MCKECIEQHSKLGVHISQVNDEFGMCSAQLAHARSLATASVAMIMCIECSGQHRKLGVHISKVGLCASRCCTWFAYASQKVSNVDQR